MCIEWMGVAFFYGGLFVCIGGYLAYWFDCNFGVVDPHGNLINQGDDDE